MTSARPASVWLIPFVRIVRPGPGPGVSLFRPGPTPQSRPREVFPIHRFAIGDRVAFTPAPLDGSARRGLYTVVRLMPSEDRDRQYRIKDLRDGHERMVRESQLSQA